ncbi:MAG: hypothetical protein CMB99_11060 [Flavobacteriaceae bacterium]|nr:hypothetical protein [Flavobacteriaceae bacterium]|tara:strand:- start:114010 stop:114684 length:675 start_codon:yes stop_codon:yes gene_type:complete
MRNTIILLILLFTSALGFAQKDSLAIGDRYADDQLYFSVSYVQLISQPTTITRSGFSYEFTTGFIKDIILNRGGTFSLGLGVGYGYQNITHQLKVEEVNNTTLFGNATGISDNALSSHNLEFPLELRWRASTANKYAFWRIYTGVKFSYNLRNSFDFIENGNPVNYSDVSAFNKLQSGLSLSIGYDAINAYLYYPLTPMFENATFNGAPIDTRALKFGVIFYLL